MSNIIEVRVVPSVNYGKFQWTYKPLNDVGIKALNAIKQANNYKVTEGRQERQTFSQEWLDQLFKLAPNAQVRVVETIEIPTYKVGDFVKPMTAQTSTDFSFLG